jgi:hypothetical protein
MRISPPDTQPLPFTDLEHGTLRIYKVKLTLWVLLVKPPVALKSGVAIRAGFNDRHLFQNPQVILVVGFQGFDHQPLIRVKLPDF